MAADAKATEGNTLTFSIKKPNLNGQSYTYSSGIRYSYKTEDVTATAGEDYTAAAAGSTVIFGGGQNVTATISVDTEDDDVDESNETFKLQLSDPHVRSLEQGRGIWVSVTTLPNITRTGKIKDND